MRSEANWKAVLSCFPTEEAALEAVKSNSALIVPYGYDAGNRASNIVGSYQVLQDKLDDEAEVLEVITKNPGVLGCVPSALEAASARDIRLGAGFAKGVDTVLGPAKRFLSSLDWSAATDA